MKNISLNISLGSKSSGVLNRLMNIPECHVIFIGPRVCARHDILMGSYENNNRISFLCLDVNDVILGNFLELINEAVNEILVELGDKVKSIMFFTGCQDCLIGTDFESIIMSLRNKYNIYFSYFQMNCMKSKKKNSMHSELYKSMFSFLKPTNKKEPTINLLGSMGSLHNESELLDILNPIGIKRILTIKGSKTFHNFLNMSNSILNIVTNQNYIELSNYMDRELGIPWIYLPVHYDLDRVLENYHKLLHRLKCEFDLTNYVNLTREKILNTKSLTRDIPINLNLLGVSYPYSLIKALIQYGFNVKDISAISFSYEKDEIEKEALSWILKNASHVSINKDKLFHGQVAKKLSTKEERIYFGFSAIDNLMDLIKEEVYQLKKTV